MNSTKNFHKYLNKLTKSDIQELSKYIISFEEILNSCNVDKTNDQGGIDIFQNILLSTLDEYLHLCGYVNGEDRQNATKPLIKYIYWLYREVCESPLHEPCISNNKYAEQLACTKDRQIAIRFSLACLKDLIMVNVPYILWCKYFTPQKVKVKKKEINPNHIKEIKAKYFNMIEKVIAMPFEKYYDMSDKYCEIESLTEKCEN